MVAVTVMVALLVGCARDAAQAGGVGPISPPKDFAKVPGQGFSIAAPDTFTPSSQQSTNGEPKLTLNVRALHPGDEPTLVAVIRDTKPRAPVVQQMEVLADVKRKVGASDVTRQDVRWPGARRSVVVGWTQQTHPPPLAPGPPVHTLQLAVQVSDGLIINVVATAPAETFDDVQVATVLRTFRLAP